MPTKVMHMGEKPNVSAFQNSKNENPPLGPFWENQKLKKNYLIKKKFY